MNFNLLNLLIFFHFIIIIFLLLLILMQKSGEDGNMLSMAKNNPIEKVDKSVIRITSFIILLFFINSVGILYLQNNKKNLSKKSSEESIKVKTNKSSIYD